jgi:hypothetical protein
VPLRCELGETERECPSCHGLKLAACWAHVLRRFRDAVVDFSEAQFMLAWIHDLYAIDARATDPQDRARLRTTESRADRTRPARAGDRAPESLRVQVGARHRRGRDHVQPRRVRQGRGGRSHAYLVEVATRAKRNPGAVLLPTDFKAAA